jgi:hypothetical protein
MTQRGYFALSLLIGRSETLEVVSCTGNEVSQESLAELSAKIGTSRQLKMLEIGIEQRELAHRFVADCANTDLIFLLIESQESHANDQIFERVNTTVQTKLSCFSVTSRIEPLGNLTILGFMEQLALIDEESRR